MKPIPGLMIAAAHKSSGKTVLSAGIAAALTQRGDRVAVFKKGPDYIDPMWLARAAGRPAYNLDFNTMSDDELRSLFARKSEGATLSLVEANKGLFDGVAEDGSDSNAAMAKLLDLSVILVVDTRGMTRGIAPLLQGYVGFDSDVRISGVILNRTGGSRHERKLRTAVETYTDLPLIGVLGASEEFDLAERHLGLTTPQETAQADAHIRNLAERIAGSIDLDVLSGLPTTCLAPGLSFQRPAVLPGTPLRIGIARDAAFGFYYQDDLEAFEMSGALPVPVDLIGDAHLPEGLDGLFIGGGFPETHAAALSSNMPMRRSVRDALESGLPAYAECGGMMYLCKSINWSGRDYPMVGFFDARAVMHGRPQGRGYVRFSRGPDALWPRSEGVWKAHEFHYASIEDLNETRFARKILRGHGIDGSNDAMVRKNVQAGFVHLRNSSSTPWVSEFLNFVASVRP